MKKEPEVKETAPYESCIDYKETTGTLSKFLEGPETEINPAKHTEEEWEKHWVGMPEFKNNEKKTHKTIQVHFRNQEDYEAFAKLIEQNLTPKTKSIWYPERDPIAIKLMRWIE